MKKAIYIITIASFFLWSFAPAMANGTTNILVPTGFQRSEGGGEAPIIKAKWEMNNFDSVIQNTSPLDDNLAVPGAQFIPTGVWGTNKNIYVCAIATDPDGVSDINAVYADIYYPRGIKLGPGHTDLGCGQQHGLEISLQKLDKASGYDLFCGNVRKNHSMLPMFNEGYDYDEICAQDGELMKETAYVYCKYTTLKWEDPAGNYMVMTHAADKAGVDSSPLTNTFEYLPLTAFEVDYQNVNYGNVKLNTHKIINGNLTWGDNIPSVRNTGNTRLNMSVMQDDMGLGKTVNGDEWWNVGWDARVGSTAQFVSYEPFASTVIPNPLELSQLEEMDFSILVTKFPLGTGSSGSYSGNLTLGAVYTDFLACLE